MADEQQLLDAFDDCLNRLKAGETEEACLQRYPALAEDLRPMLAAAGVALNASRVPHYAQMRSRQRFLTAAGQMKEQRQSAWLGWLRRSLTTGLALLIGFVIGTSGLYYASASTLPGDSLYPVKRGFENVQLRLAGDSTVRYSLEEQFSQRRVNEVQQTVQQGRSTTVTFNGLLISNNGPVWQVGAFVVHVDDSTQIVGQAQPGYYVAVEAQLVSTVLTATRIEVQDFDIAGTLVQVGDQWAINGQTFSITPDTVVVGTPIAGAKAFARLRTLQSDVVAVSLTIGGLGPTTVPTNTPGRTSATASAIAAPTTTTRPASATATPNATNTPAPTQTQVPSATPAATQTPEPSHTKEPTETREPTKTQEPSKTEEPEKTQEPSKTPEPTHTPGSGSGGSGSGGGGSGSGGSGGGGSGGGGGDGGGGGGDDGGG